MGTRLQICYHYQKPQLRNSVLVRGLATFPVLPEGFHHGNETVTSNTMTELGMMAYSYDLSILQAEVKICGVQGQPGPHSGLKASLSYMKPFLKK